MPVRRRSLLLALSTLPWTAPLAMAARSDAPTGFFDLSFGDLKDELRQARADGKLGLFLMVSAENCPPCKYMKTQVLSQAEVREVYRRHFRLLDIDYNGDDDVVDPQGRSMRAKDYAQKVLAVRGTPTFVVIGLDGRELLRHVGPTRDARELLDIARFVASGEHRKTPYDEYRRQRQAAGH